MKTLQNRSVNSLLTTGFKFKIGFSGMIGDHIDRLSEENFKERIDFVNITSPEKVRYIIEPNIVTHLIKKMVEFKDIESFMVNIFCRQCNCVMYVDEPENFLIAFGKIDILND